MAPLTKENLDVLIALQEKDKALDELKARIDAVPVQIQALRNDLEAEKKQASAAKAEATRLQVAKKEKENELQSKEDGIAKHQKELNAVKSNEAFKALIAEIEKAKEEKGKVEDEILVLMEQADQVAKAEKEEQKKLKDVEAKVQAKVQELEGVKAGLEKDHAGRRAERDAVAAQVAAELLGKYEKVRANKKGIAVVALKGHSCGGCNMRITPQLFVEIKRGDRLVVCEGCGRILHI